MKLSGAAILHATRNRFDFTSSGPLAGINRDENFPNHVVIQADTGYNHP